MLVYLKRGELFCLEEKGAHSIGAGVKKNKSGKTANSF